MLDRGVPASLGRFLTPMIRGELYMVMIGTDSHKRTHTAVALDEVGRRLAEKTVPATSDGHFALVSWAQQWPQVSFAAEDCPNMTRRLERDLLAAGHRLVRVPTRLMAQARASGRQAGKSDPIDAEAVGLAALRHQDRLPVAELDGPTRQVKLLVDHRRDLVGERTRVVNRLRWHLHELDPTLRVPARGLRSYRVIDRLGEQLAPFHRPYRPAGPRAASSLPRADHADQRPAERAW